MPDFTVTLTTAQAQRLSQAFAFLNASPANPEGTPANAAQVQTWIRRQLRARVLQHEKNELRIVADDQALETLETEGWEP